MRQEEIKMLVPGNVILFKMGVHAHFLLIFLGRNGRGSVLTGNYYPEGSNEYASLWSIDREYILSSRIEDKETAMEIFSEYNINCAWSFSNDALRSDACVFMGDCVTINDYYPAL